MGLKILKVRPGLEGITTAELMDFAAEMKKQGRLEEESNLVHIELDGKRLKVNMPTFALLSCRIGDAKGYFKDLKILQDKEFKEAVNSFVDVFQKYRFEGEERSLWEATAPLEAFFRKRFGLKEFEPAWKVLGVGKDERILDLGCGTGVVTKRLAELVGKNGKVVGVDKHDEPVRIAREHNRGMRNVEIIQADLDMHPRAKPEEGAVGKLAGGARFDKVMLIDALGYLSGETQRTALPRALHRVLRDGGHFIFTASDAPGSESVREVLDSWGREGYTHERSFKAGSTYFYMLRREGQKPAKRAEGMRR